MRRQAPWLAQRQLRKGRAEVHSVAVDVDINRKTVPVRQLRLDCRPAIPANGRDRLAAVAENDTPVADPAGERDIVDVRVHQHIVGSDESGGQADGSDANRVAGNVAEHRVRIFADAAGRGCVAHGVAVRVGQVTHVDAQFAKQQVEPIGSLQRTTRPAGSGGGWSSGVGATQRHQRDNAKQQHRAGRLGHAHGLCGLIRAQGCPPQPSLQRASVGVGSERRVARTQRGDRNPSSVRASLAPPARPSLAAASPVRCCLAPSPPSWNLRLWQRSWRRTLHRLPAGRGHGSISTRNLFPQSDV